MHSSKNKSKKATEPICVNHPTVPAVKKCERCGQYFCSECIKEEWSTTFFRSIVGQPQDFEKHFYCSDCAQKTNYLRLVLSIALLLLFLVPTLFFLIQFLL
ncbi:MAG: hypothetical protein ACFFC7_20460 [Candidatus Hermodarchaeota archaeon]